MATKKTLPIAEQGLWHFSPQQQTHSTYTGVDAIQTLLDWKGMMTVGEAAPFLRFTAEYIQKLLRAGSFPGYKLNGEWRINPADLLLWLQDRYNQ